jgi:hypothetical protein
MKLYYVILSPVITDRDLCEAAFEPFPIVCKCEISSLSEFGHFALHSVTVFH